MACASVCSPGGGIACVTGRAVMRFLSLFQWETETEEEKRRKRKRKVGRRVLCLALNKTSVNIRGGNVKQNYIYHNADVVYLITGWFSSSETRSVTVQMEIVKNGIFWETESSANEKENRNGVPQFCFSFLFPLSSPFELTSFFPMFLCCLPFFFLFGFEVFKLLFFVFSPRFFFSFLFFSPTFVVLLTCPLVRVKCFLYTSNKNGAFSGPDQA